MANGRGADRTLRPLLIQARSGRNHSFSEGKLEDFKFVPYSFHMTPWAAYQRQIEMYRAMSGEQRLQIALNLHELACNVTREGIRHQNPGITEEEVERELRRRIELSRQ